MSLLSTIQQCKLCADTLSHGPRPVLQFSPNSKIVIIGQAPGSKVHASGKPWDDQSGKKLRRWLDVSDDDFYNPDKFALVPMGFCYPGTGKSGDLPPKKICAPTWHPDILEQFEENPLVVLIGTYAQKYYLNTKQNLTETVLRAEEYLPEFLPLPHPSPRNQHWLKKNSWFETGVIPLLQTEVKKHLAKEHRL